jgi:hypothetical protein
MEFIFVLIGIVWLIDKISAWLGAPLPAAPRAKRYSNTGGDIRDYDINAIKGSGKFSAAQRKAEYRRRGQSPSGVIDGVYNDAYRGNGSYNDLYRDWDADA